jgi:hypothetical protein
MVARMTLAQIARYLGVDERAAHAALNRIGVLSPDDGEEATIILLRDLARAAAEIEQRKKWAANGSTQSRTP